MNNRKWYVLGAVVALNVIAAAMVDQRVVYVAWAILADSLRGEM